MQFHYGQRLGTGRGGGGVRGDALTTGERLPLKNKNRHWSERCRTDRQKTCFEELVLMGLGFAASRYG